MRPRRRGPGRRLRVPARPPRARALGQLPSRTACTMAARRSVDLRRPESAPRQSASAPAASARRRPAAIPTVAADGAHLQRVGHDEPTEAQLRAEAGRSARGSASRAPRRPRERGRAPSSPRGHPPRPPRRNGGSARAESASRGRISAVGSSRCESASRTRRGRGSAWRRPAHADALQALHERGDMPGHELRIRAEGPDADDRVRRIDDHVRDRREVEVQAYGGELAADRGCDAPRQGPRRPRRRARGSPGTELPVAASSRVTSPPSSSIGDQEIGPLGAERGESAWPPAPGCTLRAEQDDTADPLGSPVARTGGSSGRESGRQRRPRRGASPPSVIREPRRRSGRTRSCA